MSYEDNFSVIDDITDGLKANYPEDDMYEPTSNIMESIRQAAPVEKILMNISATDEQIYYAFLREELKGENYYNKDEKDESILDFNIATRMLKENMDYFSILKCMSYSPRLSYLGKDMQRRWQKAVITTSVFVNPILSLADCGAKPLSSIKLYREKPDVIYMSCMKAVLYKMPSLSLHAVDEEVIRLLYAAGCKDKKYMRDILSNSLSFVPVVTSSNMVDEHLAVVEAGKRLDKFLDTALENIKKQESSLHHKPTDDEIYHEMNNKIRAMKEQHDKGDRFSYWATSIHIIKDTMEKLQQMQNLSKTINIWLIGLERAAAELNLNTNPREYAELKQKIHKLMDSANDVQKKQESWDFIWLIAARLDIYSHDIMKQIAEKQQANPLLQLPEIQHAPDFANISESRAASPAALYFACLKEIVREQPCILQNQADIIVIDKLLKIGRDEEDIALALSASPSLRNLTKVQAMGAAQSMVDNHMAQKEQEKLRGGKAR